MNKPIYWVVGLVALVGVAAVWYFTAMPESAEQAAEEAAPQAQVMLPPTGPILEEEAPSPARHPVPQAQGAEQAPLPPLAESDPVVKQSVAELVGQPAVPDVVAEDDIVRRIVATVDNLPRAKVPVRLRPLKPTAGRFGTTGPEESVTLDPQNFARYEPVVRLVQAASPEQMAALYFRFYPLFQKAYEDLGYPNGYFNDRLVEVIDHLLETPTVEGPIALVQPRVFYEFADPALESRSAGQKLLIRMGSENAAIIKEKLRAFRQQIADSPAAGPAGSSAP